MLPYFAMACLLQKVSILGSLKGEKMHSSTRKFQSVMNSILT